MQQQHHDFDSIIILKKCKKRKVCVGSDVGAFCFLKNPSFENMRFSALCIVSRQQKKKRVQSFRTCTTTLILCCACCWESSGSLTDDCCFFVFALTAFFTISPPKTKELHLTLLVMCRKVSCKTCSKWTWAGCGRHIKEALAGIPVRQRSDRHPLPLTLPACRKVNFASAKSTIRTLVVPWLDLI